MSITYTKSTIRSRAALTYAEAQARIDDERLVDDITLSLRRLNTLAKVLRRRRAERGALQLASPEVKFEIDTETHDPLDVGMYQVRYMAVHNTNTISNSRSALSREAPWRPFNWLTPHASPSPAAPCF